LDEIIDDVNDEVLMAQMEAEEDEDDDDEYDVSDAENEIEDEEVEHSVESDGAGDAIQSRALKFASANVA